VRINSISTALFAGFMGVALPGALLSWALNSRWGFAAMALLILPPTTWAARRAARVRLVVSQEGVLIDNTWRSYGFPWSEVDGVGIKLTGYVPLPVLSFRRVGRPAVVAQATPIRKSVRQEFQTEVLAFAPATVQRLEDVAAGSGLGADSALSYRWRLRWVKKHPNSRWTRFLDKFGA
jgi:hypothetical protein